MDHDFFDQARIGDPGVFFVVVRDRTQRPVRLDRQNAVLVDRPVFREASHDGQRHIHRFCELEAVSTRRAAEVAAPVEVEIGIVTVGIKVLHGEVRTLPQGLPGPLPDDGEIVQLRAVLADLRRGAGDGEVVLLKRHRVDGKRDRALAGIVALALDGDGGGAGVDVVGPAQDIVVPIHCQIIVLRVTVAVQVLGIHGDLRRSRRGVVDRGGDACRAEIVQAQGVDGKGKLQRPGEVARAGQDGGCRARVDVVPIGQGIACVLIERPAVEGHVGLGLVLPAAVIVDGFADVGAVGIGYKQLRFALA